MNNKEALEILEHNWTRLVNPDYSYMELGQAQDLAIKALEERATGEFTIDELEKWLYRIAFNNTDNDLSKYCEEIIGRLDGFKRFVADMRGGAE